MSQKDRSIEINRNLLIESRARLAIALHNFCETFCEHEPCLNLRHCEECDVNHKIEDLKDQVFYLLDEI